MLLLIVLAGAALAWLVIRGISAQSSELNSQLQGAATKVEGWLKDLGVNSQTAANAKQDASGSISSAFHFLLSGLGKGLRELGSLAVFLSFTVLSLFFLLKDGPVIRNWLERHMGVPHAVARTISGRTIGSMQGYFAGVTAVAAFNGIVIGLGAFVLGVPLAGSIAVINFVAAYIPYLGAWTAGAFTVLVALGDGGPSTALAMGVITLLANGALQQLIQPIAYGAALGIHPLAVLIVTIAGGALFGTIGLIVAAPLTCRGDEDRPRSRAWPGPRRRTRPRPRHRRHRQPPHRPETAVSGDDVLLGLGLVLVLAVAAQLVATAHAAARHRRAAPGRLRRRRADRRRAPRRAARRPLPAVRLDRRRGDPVRGGSAALVRRDRARRAQPRGPADHARSAGHVARRRRSRGPADRRARHAGWRC